MPNFLIPPSVDEKPRKQAQLPNWEAFRTEELRHPSQTFFSGNFEFVNLRPLLQKRLLQNGSHFLSHLLLRIKLFLLNLVTKRPESTDKLDQKS